MLKNPDEQTAITIEEKKILIKETLFPLASVAEMKRVISSERVHQQITEQRVQQVLFS
jgi:hypothetical protein